MRWYSHIANTLVYSKIFVGALRVVQIAATLRMSKTRHVAGCDMRMSRYYASQIMIVMGC